MLCNHFLENIYNNLAPFPLLYIKSQPSINPLSLLHAYTQVAEHCWTKAQNQVEWFLFKLKLRPQMGT